MKKVAYIASECVPFIKTGGLADVVGTLPKIFDKNEYDVRVIMPNYLCIPNKYREKMQYITHFYMDIGYKNDYVGVMYLEYEGVKVYFIDNEYYFNGATPYGDVKWDIEKFCYFSKAALSILPAIGFQPDILHCHDWQAGLVPVYLKTLFAGDLFYTSMKSVMTIHNLQFQGKWDIKTIQEYSGLPDYVFTPDRMEFYKDGNMLKAGMVFSDYITTVSDTYAAEIQTPEYGEGLDDLLRFHNNKLCGIVNGIDYDVYDPNKDDKLFKKYNIRSYKKGKAQNKIELQKELGLPVDEGKYMIGIISRLTDQKGLDLVDWVMEGIVDPYVQFVVIGTGEPKYENMFKHYQWVYSDRVSANIFYSDELAHRLYAAADAMLMPSRFEPCGLTQLIALRYGTVPIVRETGGLKDTVVPYNEYEGTGTGFSFTNYNADEMLKIINYSKEIYYDHRDDWNKMVVRGMKEDFSWDKSAEKYMQLYSLLLGY